MAGELEADFKPNLECLVEFILEEQDKSGDNIEEIFPSLDEKTQRELVFNYWEDENSKIPDQVKQYILTELIFDREGSEEQLKLPDLSEADKNMFNDLKLLGNVSDQGFIDTIELNLLPLLWYIYDAGDEDYTHRIYAYILDHLSLDVLNEIATILEERGYPVVECFEPNMEQDCPSP